MTFDKWSLVDQQNNTAGGGFGLELQFKGGDALLMIEKLIVVPAELPGSADIFFAMGLQFLHAAMQLFLSGVNTEPILGHQKRGDSKLWNLSPFDFLLYEVGPVKVDLPDVLRRNPNLRRLEREIPGGSRLDSRVE